MCQEELVLKYNSTVHGRMEAVKKKNDQRTERLHHHHTPQHFQFCRDALHLWRIPLPGQRRNIVTIRDPILNPLIKKK
jgi:hypothetical protein